MGEYYAAANLDKKEYIDNNSLNLSDKMTGILNMPFSSLLVWLLMVGQDLYSLKGGRFETRYRGSWAKNMIICAGDEGPESQLKEKIYQDDKYIDITKEAMEELLESGLLTSDLWEKGLIDENNQFIMDMGKRIEYAYNIRKEHEK